MKEMEKKIKDMTDDELRKYIHVLEKHLKSALDESRKRAYSKHKTH